MTALVTKTHDATHFELKTGFFTPSQQAAHHACCRCNCITCLLPVPSSWLRGALRLVGKGDTAQRLLGKLQVNSSKARALLGCDSSHIAPFSFEAGVADMFGSGK